MKRWLRVGIVVAVLVISVGLVQKSSGTLTAIPVGYAPLLDGVASEDYWAKAPVLEIATEGGGKWKAANKSETSVRMRAVYTKDSMHLLLQWKDPSYSIDRQRWGFDGKIWSKADQVPLDKGGANTLYEDKLALLWVINAPSVVEAGDFWPLYVAPDDAAKYGYNRPVKAAPKGETLDMWHWKLVRNGFTIPAQVDDQYVDSSLDAKTFTEAGRKSDPQPADQPGGYYNNDKEFTAPDGTKVKGPKYYVPGNNNVYIITQDMIDRGQAKEIADYPALMSLPAGTALPGVVGRPHTGSRGDILGKATWRNGEYTLEISRKLNTGDAEHDVIFGDLSKRYYFGIAVFDNTQIGHGFSDLYELVFAK